MVQHHDIYTLVITLWHVQELLLALPSLAKDAVQFSWSMYTAAALRKPCWAAPIMVLVILLVATMKMLGLFVKVRTIVKDMKYFLTWHSYL